MRRYSEVPCEKTYPAPENDQWDFLLSTIWNQMIHLVIMVEGRLDEARLLHAMETALSAEPVLRCRFVESPLPCWEEPAVLPPATFFSMVRVDDAGEALRHALLQRIDPLIGPQARLTLLRGQDDIIVLSVNHSATDACGVRETAARIARAYRDPENRSFPTLQSHQAFDRSYDTILSAFTPEEKIVARKDYGEPQAEWGVPSIPGSCGSPCHLWRRIEGDLFRKVRSFSRSEKMTMNDLLLSAFFQSVSREIPHEDHRAYPVLSAMDLRRLVPGVSAPAVANLSVAIAVRLPADSTLSPLSHARETHRTMVERKRRLTGIGAAIRIQEMFGEGFHSVRHYLEDLARASRLDGYPRNPFFSNTGIIPPECTDFSGIKARCAFLVPPIDYPPGFSVAASTFRETITLVSGFCGDCLPKAVVGRVLSRMEEILRDLVR